MLAFYKKFKNILGDHINKFFLLIPLLVFSSFLELLGLSLIGPFVQSIVDNQITSNLSSFLPNNFLNFNLNDFYDVILLGTIFLITLFILKTIFSIITNILVNYIMANQAHELRVKILNLYTIMPYYLYLEKNFLNKSSENFVEIINNLSETFSIRVVKPIAVLANEIIILLVIFVYLAYIDFISLIIIASVLVFFITSYYLFIRLKNRKYGQAISESSTNIIRYTYEFFKGIKQIKSYNKENFFLISFFKYSKKYSSNLVKNNVLHDSPRYLVELLIVVIISIIIINGLIIRENPNFFSIVAVFSLASIRLLPSANLILQMLAEIRFGQHSMEKIHELIVKLGNYSKINTEFSQKNIYKIEIKNLSYNYSGEKDLFQNLNISLIPGDVLGIGGPSGIGKTTLVDLICNLIRPTKGEILINNKNIYSKNIALNISYMTQDVFFINDTILKNITLEENIKKVDFKRFEYSIAKSKTKVLIDNLKAKEQTILGENGLILSGGQKQKINFARAIYNDSDLLVLDEFTSSLDENSEAELMEVLNNLKNKIIIIISHNKKMIKKYCNKTINLKG